MNKNREEDPDLDRYFDSPQQGVEEISALLSGEQWQVLASYYDLSNTGIDKRDLVSGRFFIRTSPPPGAHPGGFWKYKHPFAPGFTYMYHTEEENDRVIVHVRIEIDQGDGCVQQGMQSFTMKKYPRGYKILPGN